VRPAEPASAAPFEPVKLADFEAFVRTHQARVRQQLRRLLGVGARHDTALADDLAQDTFVLAWRHRTQFRGQAQPSTWLYRIAYHVYLGHARRTPASLEHAEPDATDQLPAPRSDAGLRLDLERALAGLPEPERVALLHCCVMDFSHSEAAELLGWPLGTLKSHVARGKARLAERLKAYDPGLIAPTPPLESP
jgi:RNA polymerase sigma factor (sigma-70 family)